MLPNELRTRAHSTGTSSANSQAIRRTNSSYARDESGIQIGSANTTMLSVQQSPQFVSQQTAPTPGNKSRDKGGQVLEGQRIKEQSTTNEAALAPSTDLVNEQPPPVTHKTNMRMLGKNSFTCLLVGGRQSGKRTIVKCFVKLLNEFKLAAEEYKKERMLTKLMDCSERLQELTGLQEQQQQQQHDLEEQFSRRMSTNAGAYRSRVNSWLSSRPVNKFLLNLPSAVGKRRLNSVAGSAPRASVQVIAPDSSELRQQQQQQRRHTTIDQSSSFYQRPQQQQQQSNSSERSTPSRQSSRESAKFLDVPGPIGYGEAKLSTACNRSDFDINYLDQNSNDNSCTIDPKVTLMSASNQLQVPGAGGQLSTSSDQLGSCNGQLSSVSHKMRRSIQLLTPETGTDSLQAQNCESEPKQQTKIARSREQSVQIDCQQVSRAKQPEPKSRPLLSLKEMNRRRIKIKFKTRRQLSERYLQVGKFEGSEELGGAPMRLGNGSSTVANEGSSRKDQQQQQQQIGVDTTENAPMHGSPHERGANARSCIDLPDAFLVVYAINDRESFDYAKSLICQMRSLKLEVPLPIVLVANKVDLERAKLVKSEEGRTLARQNACKFMEISCTVGFNLDNLLVGIRTQLILKHHATLNSILRHGYRPFKIHYSEILGQIYIVTSSKKFALWLPLEDDSRAVSVDDKQTTIIQLGRTFIHLSCYQIDSKKDSTKTMKNKKKSHIQTIINHSSREVIPIAQGKFMLMLSINKSGLLLNKYNETYSIGIERGNLFDNIRQIFFNTQMVAYVYDNKAVKMLPVVCLTKTEQHHLSILMADLLEIYSNAEAKGDQKGDEISTQSFWTLPQEPAQSELYKKEVLKSLNWLENSVSIHSERRKLDRVYGNIDRLSALVKALNKGQSVKNIFCSKRRHMRMFSSLRR